MTSYSTAVWLRCRGASQETDRLLSSLCVRIKWDTVTGAAGEKTKNIRMKYKQHRVMPLSIRGSIFPSVSYCVTRNDSHCHCHSFNFLFCGESKMESPAVICCFLRIACYPSSIYPNRRRAYLLSLKKKVFQEMTFNPALYCSIWKQNVMIFCSYSNSDTTILCNLWT